jgi:hypothetical protein
LGIIDHDINPIWMPDLQGFAATVLGCGVEVEIAVVGRDQTILTNQQTRIRTQPTLPMFLRTTKKFGTQHS